MTARHRLQGFSQSALYIALLITTPIAVAAMGADEPGTLLRIRPQTSKIAGAVTEGVQRSPTFRRLIESIDATDGLVYVAEGTCGHVVRSCLEMSVVIAGPYRVLFISSILAGRQDASS